MEVRTEILNGGVAEMDHGAGKQTME